jgi:phosphoadenosine phosphosulfate reductase
VAAIQTPASPSLSDDRLADLARDFEGAPASELVQWAVDTFGSRLVVTASMADAVLIDVAWKVDPNVEVAFIDTQYHFAETLETRVRIQERYRLNLRTLHPTVEPDELWKRDTDACCAARKVDPLDALLAENDAWMSGLRRADDPSRANTPVITRDRRGLVKVNPIATWSDEVVDAYIAANDIIVNPLLFEGYASIGCRPCTRKVEDGEAARAGRWAGSGKTECGLHL